MKSIFISYSKTDRKVAEKIAHRLKSYYDVFIDFSGISGGTSWQSQIETSIRNSDVFILLVSPESNQSSWVGRETILADRLKKKKIPVLLSGELPLSIIELQYIDFKEDFDAGLSELLETVSKHAQPRKRNEHDADLLIAASVRARLVGNIIKSDIIIKQAMTMDGNIWKSKGNIWEHLAKQTKNFSLSKLDSLAIVETAEQRDNNIFKGHDYTYEWTVSLDGDDNVLDAIDHVQYQLHPSFKPQHQIVRSRDSGFRLRQFGWGLFRILITIVLKDGQSIKIPYNLTFNYTNKVPINLLEKI